MLAFLALNKKTAVGDTAVLYILGDKMYRGIKMESIIFNTI